jgi:formiminotetrahydrofolate cyclodeaminase
MAKAGFEGAVYNVRINLHSVTDEEFKKETLARISALSSEVEGLANSTADRVEEVLQNPPE